MGDKLLTNKRNKTDDVDVKTIKVPRHAFKEDEDDLQVISVKHPATKTILTIAKTKKERSSKDIVDLTVESPLSVKATNNTAPIIINDTRPTLTSTTTSSNVTAGGVLPRCGICLGDISHPTATVCGHVFCEACIILAIRQTAMCPSCRKKLKKGKDIHRIFI